MKNTEIQNIIKEGPGPVHIGIIMDGNGRWAKKRHLPRISGHKVGAERIEELIRFMGIPGLAELGVSKELLDANVSKMADDAMASGSPDNNPKIASKDEIIDLYYKAL